MGDIVHLNPDEARQTVLGHLERATVRKRARSIAVRIEAPFIVETEHGPIRGEAGDWLVTNHPDDDPGSDTWPVSAARFDATYEVID